MSTVRRLKESELSIDGEYGTEVNQRRIPIAVRCVIAPIHMDPNHLVHPMNDEFTLKKVRMRKWLAAMVLGALFFVILYPPAFWLCGIGIAFLASGMLSNSARTNQWMSWQNEGSLNWFEGWAAATGALLAVLPLIAVVVRSWLA
jgi:hypothetical protein